ncbi:MAG: response regulator [Cyanobacteria bacterium J06626_18]
MNIQELAGLLQCPSRSFEGCLVLDNHKTRWTLSFVQGQLLYAVNESHAARCWFRLLQQHFPKWDWQAHITQPTTHESWPIHLLNQGINQKQISLIRAKLAIRTVTQECLFELSRCIHLEHYWKPHPFKVSMTCRSVGLSSWEMKMTWSKVEAMSQEWQRADFAQIGPTQSPILREAVAAQLLPIAHQYLNGSYTLWDIAWQLDRPLAGVVQSLLPLAQDRILEFKTLPDLALPVTLPRAISSPQIPKSVTPSPTPPKLQFGISSNEKSTIACIEDSPVLSHRLKRILATAGYHTLLIHEPMRGFSELIEHRPDLILLDLMLPNADGYSVCKFLRDTPVFEKTPIVILTGQNSPIDRTRARLAGANEFLTKPPQSEKLLAIIREQLARN